MVFTLIKLFKKSGSRIVVIIGLDVMKYLCAQLKILPLTCKKLPDP